MSGGRWDQPGFHNSTDGGNYPEGPEGFASHLAPHDHSHEPLYPFGDIDSHPRVSPLERDNVHLPAQWRTAPGASGSWTTNPSVADADSVSSQAQFDGRRVEYGPIDPSELQAFGHTPNTSYHSIPTSRPSAQPLSMMEYDEATPPALHIQYGATSPSTPTGSTSSDSGSWYHAASPLSSTGDPVESIASPATTLHIRKEEVAPKNVVEASQRRRKNPGTPPKYQCTEFGNCTATFTTSHNLQSSFSL
ncbi:hypothetical protein WG66_014824 [Moniliophthora roreri]|nr:hypothetical protein WG66_014824 [Moniliophthora roreri]